MSEADAPERFAYGDNQIDGCPCPVLATGREMTGMLIDIAERYDQMAQDRFEDHEGTVPFETAKELWQETVDQLREDRDRHRELSEDWEYHNTFVAEADEIRIELFE